MIRDGFENLGVARTLQIEIDFDSDALEFLAAVCMDEGKGIDENQKSAFTPCFAVGKDRPYYSADNCSRRTRASAMDAKKK